MIGVSDLDRAIANYRKLGFRVERGGYHSGGVSYNALIYLSDGTFLELFAFRPRFKTTLLRILGKLGGRTRWRRNPAKGHLARFTRNLYGNEGLMDFCVRTPHLKQTLNRLQSHKISVSTPKSFWRLRPDKIRMSWQLVFPKTLTLPFLIGPVLPNILKEPEEYQHENETLGVKSLTIGVHNLGIHIEQFRNFFEIDPSMGREDQTPVATFELSPHRIHLLEVSSKKEEGLLQVELLADPEPLAQRLSPGLLHGANISLGPRI